MRSRKTSLRIGVSSSGITILETEGWIRPTTTVSCDAILAESEDLSAKRIVGCLQSVLRNGKFAGRYTTMVLSDEWVRLFMVTPPANCGRLQDCQAAAQMRFQTLYGESPTNWAMSADWKPVHPFLACAVPVELLDGLRAAAAEFRLVLVEIVPQFIAAWNRWRSTLDPGAWFGVAHANVITVAALSRQGIAAVRTARTGGEQWSDSRWLPDHVRREALRHDIAAPAALQLCGCTPSQGKTGFAEHLRVDLLDAGGQREVNDFASAGVALARTGMRL